MSLDGTNDVAGGTRLGGRGHHYQAAISASAVATGSGSVTARMKSA